jgi:hypothetical protein
MLYSRGRTLVKQKIKIEQKNYSVPAEVHYIDSLPPWTLALPTKPREMGLDLDKYKPRA